MLFNSLSFAFFFPVAVVLYYLIPGKFRTHVLLLASCVFYMAFVPKYIFILFFLITLDFFLAQLIEKYEGKWRTFFLWASIAANIGMLFFFKYFDFFNVNVAALANVLHWNYTPTLLSVALPLGLSFHVFQSLSYVIEVYRRRYTPERNYFTYALYVMFFPQLVAGPIERPAHLLPQLKQVHSFDANKVRRGLERMLWGFFKKLVIADNIAPIVTHVYSGAPTDGLLIIIVMVLFAYQIYCDFSGYSDIAIGAALVLGFDIMENFNRPYASTSIAEFWRRWHISLSLWFRDYLYIPLGGSRVYQWRFSMNILVVFLASGVWHGANWTFVVWGFLHGLFIILGSMTLSWRERIAAFIGLPRIRHAVQVVITFTLVTLGWVVFRSQDLPQAWWMISHVWVHGSQIFDVHYLRYEVFTAAVLGASKLSLLVIGISILTLEIVQYLQMKAQTMYVWETTSNARRLMWSYGVLAGILFFGNLGAQTFIYFQF